MLKNIIFLLDKNDDTLDTTKQKPDETLYVTDHIATGRKLQSEGRFVILALTEENKAESFEGFPFVVTDVSEVEPEYYQNVYKRFVNEPWEILQTDRCIIRETTEEDVNAFYEIYSEPSITEFMEPLFEKREDELEYTRQYRKNIYEFYGFGMWTIVEKSTGKVIGRAGISYREGFDKPELGFMVAVPYQGKGIAYEVCLAILDYVKEYHDIDKTLVLVEPKNTPSIRLCEKLGVTLVQRECLGHYLLYEVCVIDNC